MPIFEQLRAQGDLPCTYPLHMASHGTAFIRGGSRSTPLSPHAPHCHPSTHWVSFAEVLFYIEAVLDIFLYHIENGKKKCERNVFPSFCVLVPLIFFFFRCTLYMILIYVSVG